MLFELPGDANLFGIGGLAEQNFHAGLRHAVFSGFGLGGGGLGNGRLFSNNIKERPRQVLARSNVGENAFNSGSKTQSARTQEDDGGAADARIGLFAMRRSVFDKFASRRELHDHAL